MLRIGQLAVAKHLAVALCWYTLTSCVHEVEQGWKGRFVLARDTVEGQEVAQHWGLC